MKELAKTQKPTFNLLKIFAVVVLVLVGVFIYFQSIKQSAQVAEIAGSTCTSNLLTFQAINSCGSDGFTQYTYSCKQNASGMITTPSSCVSFRTAYNDALAKCGVECVEPPKPTSTSVDTSTPTPKPSIATSTPTPKPSITTTTIPSNCLSWFDGCNTCSVINGRLSDCTKMACKSKTEAARCLKYAPTSAPTCVPYPSCKPGVKCAVPALAKGRSYCATPTPVPSPSCVPNPCSAGQKCKLPQLTDGRTYCDPVPTKCRYTLGRFCIFR